MSAKILILMETPILTMIMKIMKIIEVIKQWIMLLNLGIHQQVRMIQAEKRIQ